MAVYGNKVVRVNSVREASVKQAAAYSAVLEEYANYSTMLENCTSASEGVVLEAQVSVLREASIKDIASKVKRFFEVVAAYIDKLISLIEQAITKAVANSGLVKFWKTNPEITDTAAAAFKNAISSSKSTYAKYVTLEDPNKIVPDINVFKYQLEQKLSGAVRTGVPADDMAQSAKTRLEGSEESNYAGATNSVIAADIKKHNGDIINIIQGNYMFTIKKKLNNYKIYLNKASNDVIKAISSESHPDATPEDLSETMNSVKVVMQHMKEAANEGYEITKVQFNAVWQLTKVLVHDHKASEAGAKKEAKAAAKGAKAEAKPSK
jgi:hypothetical protein